jgi:ComF family protein
MRADLGCEALAPGAQQSAVEQEVLLAHEIVRRPTSYLPCFRSIISPMPMSEADSATAPAPAEAAQRRLALKSVLAPLADLLLPPVCIVCRTRIGGHGLICGACFAKIEFIAPPLCDRLGVPLPYDTGEGRQLSAAAIAKPPVYDRARAVARYSSTMRELIQSFKYRDRHEGLPLFGRWLRKAGADLLADADLIVPVPLYSWRLWSRRFNQSAMLTREVGRLAHVPVDCLALRRVRRTISQVGLSPDQRRRNVAGAIKVPNSRASAVAGKSIVLIDDVITTGATADACARALRRAGAVRIDVLALARAVEPGANTLA